MTEDEYKPGYRKVIGDFGRDLVRDIVRGSLRFSCRLIQFLKTGSFSEFDFLYGCNHPIKKDLEYDHFQDWLGCMILEWGRLYDKGLRPAPLTLTEHDRNEIHRIWRKTPATSTREEIEFMAIQYRAGNVIRYAKSEFAHSALKSLKGCDVKEILGPVSKPLTGLVPR